MGSRFRRALLEISVGTWRGGREGLRDLVRGPDSPRAFQILLLHQMCVSAMRQFLQTGLDVFSASGIFSGRMSVHSTIRNSGLIRHGLCRTQLTSPNGLPQQRQDCPAYHFFKTVPIRPSSGASSNRFKHARSQARRSAHREQSRSRRVGLQKTAVKAACPVDNCTAAGNPLPGHVITLVPRKAR